MKKTVIMLAAAFLPCFAGAQTNYDLTKMQREQLDRGVVALRTSEDSVLVSWRYLSTDPQDTRFAVYRNGKKMAELPARHSTTYMDYNPSHKRTKYEVRPLGTKGLKGSWTLPADAPIGYIDIPLNQPTGFTDIDGNPVTYVANDASAADLDGDGQMELILKWDPSNSKDNSQSGVTNNTFIDAYKLDGTQLWRIDMGRNIRSGAHYTQFMVYDLDGDGRAELVVKTGDGTTDGKGKVIGDPSADYRVGMADNGEHDYNSPEHPRETFRQDQRGNRGGFIMGAPEYLTLFDGQSGAEITTVDYIPQQGDLNDWGDNYANRSERYLACVAYLDGQHPSVVMCRGYYTRTVLAAWDFDGRELKSRWVFDSNNWPEYAGQGNHNLRVADVDGDGCDEITYGSCCIDNDGTGLYSTGFGHGDAMHLTAFFPLNDELQVWDCHENHHDGSDFRDARTGQVIFQIFANDDVGRCMAADIDPVNPGLEMWSSRSDGIRNVSGEVIDSFATIPVNMAVWWDGDLTREMLDKETISKYSRESHSCRPLLVLEGCEFNNGTKSNPCLQGDIIGDWREEIVARTKDNQHLRIYVSPLPTDYRFHSFLENPVYRHCITTQNVAYNQPTQVGFYFGSELKASGRLFRGWQF